MARSMTNLAVDLAGLVKHERARELDEQALAMCSGYTRATTLTWPAA